MRRKNREVTNAFEICKIINCCKVFRVAAAVSNEAYIVPLNFGYEYTNGVFTFYFHCAAEGKKLDMFKQNNKVCFEMDCLHELTTGETACEYGFNYSSVIGNGQIELLTDFEAKTHGLTLLMLHQTGKSFNFTQRQADAVTVCKITAMEITAKRRNE